MLDRQKDGEAWRKQKHVTIHFPAANKLEDPVGIQKLYEYIGWQSVLRRAMELSRIKNELESFGSLALDKHPYPRETCIRAAQRLPTLGDFFGDRPGLAPSDLDSYSNSLVRNFEIALNGVPLFSVPKVTVRRASNDAGSVQ